MNEANMAKTKSRATDQCRKARNSPRQLRRTRAAKLDNERLDELPHLSGGHRQGETGKEHQEVREPPDPVPQELQIPVPLYVSEDVVPERKKGNGNQKLHREAGQGCLQRLQVGDEADEDEDDRRRQHGPDEDISAFPDPFRFSRRTQTNDPTCLG
jgi:hypothetical protein